MDPASSIEGVVKQATVLESRHNGRAYELLDDEGKIYYRGRCFLRPVHQKKNKNEATVNRCYTTKTEEFADTAMESTKPSYGAILSSDKAEGATPPTDVHVNDRARHPRSAPINSGKVSTRTRQPRIPEDSNRQHILNLHDKELRGQRNALVLDGPRLRTAPLRLLEAPPLLQVPRPIKGHTGRPNGTGANSTRSESK